VNTYFSEKFHSYMFSTELLVQPKVSIFLRKVSFDEKLLLDLKFVLYFSTMSVYLTFGQNNSSTENYFGRKHDISNFHNPILMKVLPRLMILPIISIE
jgi:hypothetical protein